MKNERPDEPELDDWFDEPDTADVWSARTERLARERYTQHGGDTDVDDRLGDRAAGARARPTRGRVSHRAVFAVVAVLLLLLFGVLAAAGLFSGNQRKAAAGSTTSTPHASSTPKTTAPVTLPQQVPALPAVPLKPGDRGTAVSQLQRALEHVGYSPGTIDGVYGAATTRTVTHFQQAHGLTADGIAGRQTLAALKRALQPG
jgi:hypothetical protein